MLGIYSKVSLICFWSLTKLIVKYNIGLKTLMQQGISESVFYGDLVQKNY